MNRYSTQKPDMVKRTEKRQKELFEPTGGVSAAVVERMSYYIRRFDSEGGRVWDFSRKDSQLMREKLGRARNQREHMVHSALGAIFGTRVLVAFDGEGEVVGAVDYKTLGGALQPGDLGSVSSGYGFGVALEVGLARVAAKKGLPVRSECTSAARDFHLLIGRWVGVPHSGH